MCLRISHYQIAIPYTIFVLFVAMADKLFTKLVAEASDEMCDTESKRVEYVMEMLGLGYLRMLEVQRTTEVGADGFCGFVICKLLCEVASMQKQLQTFKNATSSSPSSSDSDRGEDSKEDQLPMQRKLIWKGKVACQLCDATEYDSIEREKQEYTRNRIMLSTRTAELQNMQDLTKIKQADDKFREQMAKKQAIVAKLANESARLYKNCQERMAALEQRAKSDEKPRCNIKRAHQADVHVQKAKKMFRSGLEQLDKVSENLKDED